MVGADFDWAELSGRKRRGRNSTGPKSPATDDVNINSLHAKDQTEATEDLLCARQIVRNTTTNTTYESFI